MNTITFNGKAYPTREINLPNYGYVLISISELNSLLINDKGDYESAQAKEIDQLIYYFVEPIQQLLTD
jgi:hypothetical protein